MKKLLTIILLIISLFIISGCEKEYSDKKIISIEYVTIDYNGGYRNIKKIDFIEDKVYGKGYLPVGDKTPEYTELYSIDDSKEQDFINEIYNAGLLSLKAKYKTLQKIIDGGGWDLIITYEDGTTKKSTGSNAGPYKIFTKCDEIFYNYYNESFFGRVSINKNAPGISISITHPMDNGISSLSTGLVASNYKYNNQEVNNINNLEFANLNNYYSFKENISYTILVGKDKKEVKEIVLKSYDKNGGDEKIITPNSNKYNYEYALENNRIYIFDVTYKNGYAQFPFSTIIETYEKLPSDFSFRINVKENNQSKSYDYKYKLLSNGINSIYYEIPHDVLLQLYKEIDQNNFFDIGFTYGTGTGKSDYVLLYAFYKGTGKTITVYDNNESIEGYNIEKIVNNIYNKYLKEIINTIPTEIFTVQENTIFSNNVVTIKILENNKFIITTPEKEYQGSYNIYGNTISLVTDDYWYHFDLLISDGYIILEKYFTTIAYTENKYFFDGTIYTQSQDLVPEK